MNAGQITASILIAVLILGLVVPMSIHIWLWMLDDLEKRLAERRAKRN